MTAGLLVFCDGSTSTRPRYGTKSALHVRKQPATGAETTEEHMRVRSFFMVF